MAGMLSNCRSVIEISVGIQYLPQVSSCGRRLRDHPIQAEKYSSLGRAHGFKSKSALVHTI